MIGKDTRRVETYIHKTEKEKFKKKAKKNGQKGSERLAELIRQDIAN